MNCKCWEETNTKLREMNLRLVGATFLVPSFTLVPIIATGWIDDTKAPKGQKRRPTAMLATHCPFCGTKIEVPKEVEEPSKAGE
jgi:hypothetical protein